MSEKSVEQIDAELEQLKKQREEVLAETRNAVLEDVKQKIRQYRITKTELRGALPQLRRTKRKGTPPKKS
jgi:ElaB/YqjD/DUF883 family membrane-anchored ribosome-binding protein